MVNRSTILQALPPFNNKVVVLDENQSVSDIMQGMQQWHKKFAADYNLIAKYFVGSTPTQTLKNIFQFLKNNCKYVIEDLDKQSVRGPAAIVATGNTIGIDCKNYSLFIAGVLDAINRSGVHKIPFVYRFASYDMFNEDAGHVFIVAFPGTQKEIWIDPVLEQLNQRTPAPFHTIDKKFQVMALQGVSGVPATIGLTLDTSYITSQLNSGAYNVPTKPSGGNLFNSLFSTASSFIPGGSLVTGALSNLFGGEGGNLTSMFDGTAGEYNVNEDVQEILQTTPLRDDINYLVNAIPGLQAQLPIAYNNWQNGRTAATRERGKSFYEAYQTVIKMFQERIAQLQRTGQNGSSQANTNGGGSNNLIMYAAIAAGAYFLLKK